MAIQQFDQLNSLRTKSETWFDKMDISAARKKQRVDLSIDYCEIIIMLFLLITEQEYEKEECYKFAYERLKIIAEKAIGIEDVAYINDWAEKKSKQIVDDTFEHYEQEIEDYQEEEEKESNGETKETPTYKFKEFDVEIPQDEYWTSDIRALLIGINLATTVTNFYELSEAINKGCTRKVWITEADDKVRTTHQEVHGQDIPINDLFLVGASYMLMPGDTNNGAEEKEIANCRCSLFCY